MTEIRTAKYVASIDGREFALSAATLLGARRQAKAIAKQQRRSVFVWETKGWDADFNVERRCVAEVVP